MKDITTEQLMQILSIPKERAVKWLPHIINAMNLAEVNTPKRISCFISQVGHETARLRYSKEVWGPTKQQLRYEGTPLATRLGNTQVGDGKRYLGRGLLQVTGRYNYRKFSTNIKKYIKDAPDFEKYPELLETPEWAALSAALYWIDNKLNTFADSGDFLGLTKAINGGTNGLIERQELFAKALSVLA